MKIISKSFRCDLCGRYSNVGATESYNLPDAPDVAAHTTICVHCIVEATKLLLDGVAGASIATAPDPE